MTQAKEENWAQPNTFPDWVSRITVEGDVRVRDESRLYSGSNSNEITDFARMNAKGPYDVNPQGGNSYPPMLNTREDRRNQLRAPPGRARRAVRVLDRRHPPGHGQRRQPGVDLADAGRRHVQEGHLAGPGLPDLPSDGPPSPADDRQSVRFHRHAVLERPELRRRGRDLQAPAAGPRRDAVRHAGRLLDRVQRQRLELVVLQGRQERGQWLLAAQAGAEWKVNNRNSARLAGLLPLRQYRGQALQPLLAVERRPELRHRLVASGLHAEGQHAVPAARHHGQSGQPRRHAAAAVRGPGVQVRPAGREPALGHARVRRPGPAPERQLSATWPTARARSGAARRVIWSTTSTRTAKCRAVRTPGCCRPRWAVRST